MSDDLDIETDEDGNEYVRIPKDQALNQRELSRKAKDAEAAAAEAADAKRELAFLKAGVNPEDSKVAALFVKSYDGELTADAIKAAYAELGVAEKPAEQANELTPEQIAQAEAEARQTQERSDLTRGAANAAVIPDRDPREVAAEAGDAVRRNNQSNDVAIAAAFGALTGSAAGGDRRVIIPSAWERAGQ